MKPLQVLFLAPALILSLAACGQRTKVPAPPAVKISSKELTQYSVATFAAGCFWHEEALFESIKGVKEAVSGYAGGTTKNPSYEDLETGTTGHAETVNVYYDPAVVSYATLLKVYFGGQDPTSVNGQGGDRGTQYRSIAFYRTAAEKAAIEAEIKAMNASGRYSAPIAVQVMPFTKFWEAEGYHQDYIVHNPGQGYVQGVCVPEIREFQKKYPQLIKPDHRYE
jgi:peptide-methionine (S)-S-oxide reductase